MRLYEVMELPASEINFWQAYYSIFPMPQERADARFAMVAAVIANVSGKSLKRAVKEKDFMPDYIGVLETEPVVIQKSLAEQNEDWADFKKRYKAVTEGL